MAWHVVLFFHDTGHKSFLGIISIACHASRNSNIRCPLIVLERWTPIQYKHIMCKNIFGTLKIPKFSSLDTPIVQYL